MSVYVKGIGGPDNKKFYDFDQVFGGAEGNSQVDVFRDTKHLMLSVVDGYNVCMFAYGQTGAGTCSRRLCVCTLIHWCVVFRQVLHDDRLCRHR